MCAESGHRSRCRYLQWWALRSQCGNPTGSLSLLSACFIFFSSAFKEKVYETYKCHTSAMSYFSCCSNTYPPSLQSLEATSGLKLETTSCCKRGLLQWRDYKLFKGTLLLLSPPQGHAMSTASGQSRRRLQLLYDVAQALSSWLWGAGVSCPTSCKEDAVVGKDGCTLMIEQYSVRYHGCIVLQRARWRYLCFVSVHAAWLCFCLIWSLPDHCECTAFFHFLPLRCCPWPSLSLVDFPC